jgi:hypothetical protein
MKSFSAVIVASMATSAMAFAPASTKQCSTSLNAAMPDRMWNTMVDKTERSKACPWLPRAINLDGSLPGEVGFDPFYLSSISKNFVGFIQPPQWESTEGISTLYWMREAELKHSRVAMLAIVGWLATDNGFRFPGDQFSVANVPDSFNAHDILVGQGSMAFMLLAVGFVEFCSSAVLVQVSKGELERDAGDFSLGLDRLKNKSPEFIFDMKTKEINNGRLAMLAFGGISTQTAMGDAFHAFPYAHFS